MVETKRKSRSGDAEPGAKRQRVSRACDQCRSAREKCDGIQPICFTCASSNRDCTYTANPKRRGIQPGYIRTLELSLQWILNNVPGSEDALISLLQDERGQALIASNDAAASNKLHKKWRKNIVSSAIDRVLSGESMSDLFDHPMSTSGDEDEDDDTLREQPSVPHPSFLTPDSLKMGVIPFQTEDFAVPQLPDLNHAHPSMAPTTNEPQLTRQPISQILQLPPNHWRLIDVYFAYTHSWLPLASKEHILKLCYSYAGDGLELAPGRESADHAELWSMLALASIQNQSTRPNDGCVPATVMQIAESLSCTVLAEANVGHCAALFNLALLSIALQRVRNAWALLGRAMRMAMWLKFEQTTKGSPEPREQERLKGLLLGCFVVETIIAAQMGMVPFLRTDSMTALGLLSEEGLDEWQPWSACEDFQSSKHAMRSPLPSQARSTFNQLVKLCFVINDRICERFLSRPASGDRSNLSAWLSALPASLGPLHSMSLEQTSPQKLHLFLTFLVGRTYDIEHGTVIEESLSVLDHFTYTLGLAAMPPLFACFLHILKDKAESDGFQQNRLAGMLTRFSSVWREPGNEALAISPSTAGRASPATRQVSTNNTTPRPSTALSTSLDMTAISPHNSMPSLQRTESLQSTSNMMQQPQMIPATDISNLPAQQMMPQYDNNLHLRNYSTTSDQSMDLDALFDHFTSIEGADQPGGLHPQFMQNLGFAPNSNLADLMASDYGWALDPG